MFYKKQIKVLIISGIYIPDIGGPAIFVHSLSNYLKANNVPNEIITLAEIDKPFVIKKDLIQIKRNSPKIIRTILLMYFILSRSLKSTKVLCCGLIFESFMANIMMRKKLVFRFVGDSIWEKYIGPKDRNSFFNYKYNLKLKIILKFRNFILRKYSLVITPSNFLKKYLKNNIGIKEFNIKVINNFPPISPESIIIEDKNFYINKKNLKLITLSRLVKWKNIDNLIKALRDIKNVELHILGSGPEEKNLKELVKCEKMENIKFHGIKDRQYCLKILKSCDCFVQLSSYEGMSFSILESLYFCKPMILSDIEPNYETARDAAIYVNNKKIYTIKEAINQVKSKKIRNNLIKKCHELLKIKYKKDLSLEQYRKLLIV